MATPKTVDLLAHRKRAVRCHSLERLVFACRFGLICSANRISIFLPSRLSTVQDDVFSVIRILGSSTP